MWVKKIYKKRNQIQFAQRYQPHIKRIADHNDEATFKQNKTEIFLGFFPPSISLSSFHFRFVVCHHLLCIVVEMKNRNILKCSSFHRTKSAFLSLCMCLFTSHTHIHCFSILLLAIRLCVFDLQCYKSFSILNMLHAYCLLSLLFKTFTIWWRFALFSILTLARPPALFSSLSFFCSYVSSLYMYATCESSLIYSEKYSSFQSKQVSIPVYCLFVCSFGWVCVNFVRIVSNVVERSLSTGQR